MKLAAVYCLILSYHISDAMIIFQLNVTPVKAPPPPPVKVPLVSP